MDDFGASPKANANILEIARLGKAARVSVMMNGEFTNDEADTLLATGVQLDIHLDVSPNVEEGRKLKKGALGRILLFLKNYLTGKADPQKIKGLWEKQIRDFQSSFGKSPDGLNSHEHTHFFPPYFKVALELARKYDVPYVRLGFESFGSPKPVSLILNFLRKFDRKHLSASGRASSAFLISSDWIKNFDFEKCEKNPFDLNGAEVIFHPERDEEFKYLKTLAGEFGK